MIHPTDSQLLAAMADALNDTVLPELRRGSAARKQLQAAIPILRRLAYAAPGKASALAADNADMAETIQQIEAILSTRAPRQDQSKPVISAASGDAAALNERLQSRLAALQAAIPLGLADATTPLLTNLYRRMTDRALTAIPASPPRSQGTPS